MEITRILHEIKKLKYAAFIFVSGVVITIFFGFGSFFIIEHTGSSKFCMICHEMRIVGEQGWKRSVHYHNPKGIVAECKDCHIPPEIFHMLWTKGRDGTKDIFVHFFGNSESDIMDWRHLQANARRKISDSSCLKCHSNLTPRGTSIKVIIAHRAYERLKGSKKCIDCHKTEFHGEFLKLINNKANVGVNGGDN